MRVFESVLTSGTPVVVYGRLHKKSASSVDTEGKVDIESGDAYRSNPTMRILDGEVDHGGGWIQVHGERRLWLRDHVAPALLMTLGAVLIVEGAAVMARADSQARLRYEAMRAPACQLNLYPCSLRAIPSAQAPTRESDENDGDSSRSHPPPD
jgi:hypothetical protein